MGQLSLSAAVGDKKGGDGKVRIANKAQDVKLVQLMLTANGKPVAVSGTVDPKTVAAIKTFQKAAGQKEASGVIAPGDATWRAGLPKLKALHERNLAALSDRIMIRENGKEKVVSRAEYEAKSNQVIDKVRIRIDACLDVTQDWLDFIKDAEDALQGAHGFFRSISEFTIGSLNDKAKPPYDVIHAARKEAVATEKMVRQSKVNMAALKAQHARMVSSYNTALKAFKSYLDARAGTAGKVATGLSIVRDTGFTVIEVYATAQIVVTRGMDPVRANALAASGCEAIKTGAGEFGEWTAGGKVTLTSAGKKIILNTAFAGGSALIGGKISGALGKKAAARIAARLASALPAKVLNQQALKRFVYGFLTSKGGASFVESIAKETFNMLKKGIEAGKVTGKDFTDAFMNSLVGAFFDHSVSAALTNFVKNLRERTGLTVAKILYARNPIFKDFSKDMRSEIAKHFPPEVNFAKLYAKHGKAIEEKVIKTLASKPYEAAANAAIENVTKFTSDKMLDLYSNQLRKDPDVHTQMDALIIAETKKYARQMAA